MKRYTIKVKGLVQGVGFRPYIYNLAIEYKLKGFIKNNSSGVIIEIQGPKGSIFNLLENIKNNPPPLAYIEKIDFIEGNLLEFNDFKIRESSEERRGITLISDDIAICSDCKCDIDSKENNRYNYPFTNCTNCGPRYSIIKDNPYDRKNTTMDDFKMCSNCSKEYEEPRDRRFHAEPISCNICGPKLWVCDKNEKELDVEPIEFTIERLIKGDIVAIKGIGGFHLVCNGLNNMAINNLRKRKNRKDKPFALMMKSIEVVKEYCFVSEEEEKILIGNRKPIVILKVKNTNIFKNSVAPNYSTVGVMLPYSPLHYIIFKNKNIKVLVMTSGNNKGMPIEYENKQALRNLKEIADYFLLNNRDIISPIDDSVIRVINGKSRVIRRARGYAQDPIKIQGRNEILALGANMQNTFAISKEGHVFLSPYNGDLGSYDNYEEYLKRINHFKSLYNTDIKYVVYDKHKGYNSSIYGESYEIEKLKVFHHHSHIVSCMTENNVKGKVIGVALDGTGLGDDGKLWGGEVIVCDYADFTRKAHLNYIKLPGGEKAIKENWRIAVSYIYDTFKNRSFLNKYSYKDILNKLYGEKADGIIEIMKLDINSPKTSSMGRLFDAVSSLIGIRHEISYEGQAASELEELILEESNERYDFSIINWQCRIIDTSLLVEGVLEDVLSDVSINKISLKFHNTIIEIVTHLCKLVKAEDYIDQVALSGGCFQNKYLLEGITNNLENEGFVVFSNSQVPTNDGGIALGQITICNNKIPNS